MGNQPGVIAARELRQVGVWNAETVRSAHLLIGRLGDGAQLAADCSVADEEEIIDVFERVIRHCPPLPEETKLAIATLTHIASESLWREHAAILGSREWWLVVKLIRRLCELYWSIALLELSAALPQGVDLTKHCRRLLQEAHVLKAAQA